MKQKHVDKLNEYFREKTISEAFLAGCYEQYDCLSLGIAEPQNRAIGILFYNIVYFSGPFRWNKVNLECELIELEPDVYGIKIEDKSNKFMLKSYGPIEFGDTNEVIPSE